MTRAFHLLTGEYPPASGGVGDYCQLVAEGLAARGCDVHVWSPAVISSRTEGLVHLHQLPDHFAAASRRALAAGLAETPGRVLLQYVPNALGARGANLRFCVWLRRLARQVNVRVMFHEPYFYFGWQHPARNGLAVVQRLMAAVLLRTAPVAYLSTDTWRRYLEPWAPAQLKMIVTPVPATIDRHSDPAAVSRWRMLLTERGRYASVVGHFGTYGEHVTRDLRNVIARILDAGAAVRIVCLGRGSDEFVRTLQYGSKDRVFGTGHLSRAELTAALRACDLVVQPYPDGVTTRRTSVMAALANGVAAVTSRGPLTEPLWAEHGAVRLADAQEAAAFAGEVIGLLNDPAGRAALGARGQCLYDTVFALERTIDALLHDAPEPAGA